MLFASLALLGLPAAAQAAPPVGCFTVSPSSPLTNETTTLNSSCSTDDRGITSRAWDLDNDGQFDDGTASSVTKTWPTAGTYTVRLRVTDDKDASITSKSIVVRNRAPTAAFTVGPASTQPTGVAFTFTSTSTDADGTVVAYAWDTDGDATADFNDGTEPTATKSFPNDGTQTIRLRVTDNNGAQSVTTRTVTVTNRGPAASFTINPASPSTGQSITFTSNSTDADGTIVAQQWDTDGDAVTDFNDGTGVTATRTFAAAGTYTIRLQVTDNDGVKNIATRTVTVGNRPPVASIIRTPTDALTFQDVTLTSTSTDPDGTIVAYAWDLNGDGVYDDGTTASVKRNYATPGDKSARLRVTDDKGAQSTFVARFTIGNRAPAASFTIAPETIVEGDTVTLTSTATDADGTIAGQAWDLNNDGAYDDGTDATASFIPAAPGAYSVGLRVVDDQNVARAVTQTITVGARPASPSGEQTFDVSTPTTPTPAETPPLNPVAPLRFLDPFPVIRLRGRTTGKGARLSSFTVRAPHGSSVSVRCSGRGCPVKKWNKTVKTKRKRGSGTLHVRKLERFLPKGLQVEVRVSNKDMVGKYTRIKVRGLAVPIRSDRCLLPGSSKPSACPSVP